MTTAMSNDTTKDEMLMVTNNSFYGGIINDNSENAADTACKIAEEKAARMEKKITSIHEMLDSNISMLRYQLQKADSEVGNAKRTNEYWMQVVKLENNAKVIAGKLELLEEVKKYIGNIEDSLSDTNS